MGHERLFDYEFNFPEYIARKLREIDDMKERKFAERLLEDDLMKIIEETEKAYKKLEDSVYQEYECPSKHHEIYVTMVRKQAVNIKNEFLYPVDQEDQGQYFCYLGDYNACKQLIEANRIFKGKIAAKEGETEAKFKVRPNRRFMGAAERLYQLYTQNGIPWTTVNLSYFHKFFDVVPIREESENKQENENYTVDLEEFAALANWNIMPVWNVSKEEITTSDFMVPCEDELAWEHRIALKTFGIEHTYLFYQHPDLISYRRDENDLVLRTNVQELPKLQAIKIAAPKPLKEGYDEWPLLGNGKKDSFTRRYLSHTGVELQTEAELVRKIHELDLHDMLRYIDSQIVAEAVAPYECYKMNPFEEEGLFDTVNRRVLQLRFEKRKGPDWLIADMMSFVVSEVQRSFPQFHCEGRLV